MSIIISGLWIDEMQQSDYVNVCGEDEFCDFAGDENLLDIIDFDDFILADGINDEDDEVLPDLEIDPHHEILAEFSSVEESSHLTTTTTTTTPSSFSKNPNTSDFGLESISKSQRLEEANDVGVRKDDVINPTADSDHKKAEKGRKSSSKSSRQALGKRKVKVDWTPELHRRFVEAVEELGVDKAVPSRILELMGIHCRLTRHNIASHLQKYRSHRKHLLTREVETASWTLKQRLYSTATAGAKNHMNMWHAPTIGFPPMAPPMPPCRPLHVWGHPPANNHPLMHVWPKHLGPSPTLPGPVTAWPSAAAPHPHPPQTPPTDLSFWHSQHLRRYTVPPIPGIPHPTMYTIKPGFGVPTALARQAPPQPLMDIHPSKESIDAAIGDVLLKPWLPLPLGLKPPSVDGVLMQLQDQGVPDIPPSTPAT